MSYSSLVSLVLSSRPSLWILHSITFRTISFGKKKARRPLNKPVIRFSATCVTGNSLIMRTRHPSIRVRHLTMKWSLNKIIFRLRLNRRHDQALAACVRNQYFVWTKHVRNFFRIHYYAELYINLYSPIQSAQCRFPGLAISNAKILIYFSNKLYGSNFIEQHSEIVMVWNYQNVDCSLIKNILV